MKIFKKSESKQHQAEKARTLSEAELKAVSGAGKPFVPFIVQPPRDK